jgi:hypothetical protein
MEHTRTTPQQSVILKKIGYDVPDTHYWLDHLTQGWLEETGYAGEESNYNNDHSWIYTRPKLTDVATWLRTVHGWHVSVIAGHKHRTWSYIVTDDDGYTYTYGDDDETPFGTHDIALSAGIDFILTKITEDGK